MDNQQNTPPPPLVEPSRFDQPVAPQQESVPPSQPPKKSRRKLLIVSIIAALLLAAAALAFNFWYQQPNKVVNDAIMNAINAKTVTHTGTLTTTGETKLKVTFNGSSASDRAKLNAEVAFDVQGTNYTLAADALVDSKNDLYFKVKNIDKLIENYRRTVSPESQQLFDAIVAKVDDKWVKVSAQELKNYSPDAAQAQGCMTDAMQKLQDDPQVKSQLGDLYKRHQFITIEKQLGDKDGSLGYVLGGNEAAAKAFAKGLRDTSIYKSLQKCDPSFTIDDKDLAKTDDSKGQKTPTVELWVSRWSHEITRATVKGDDGKTSYDVILQPAFNKSVTIETPEDATTLKQLQEDVQGLVQSAAVTTAP